MDTRLQAYLVYLAFSLLMGVVITPLVFWGKGRKPASGFFVGALAVIPFGVAALLILWFALRRRPPPDRTGFDLAVAYNLGVAALMGGRVEEARFYFTQVTHSDPRHVGAWLYLVNLATSPLEALSFVQQARAIDPTNPLVHETATLVWSQVQRYYSGQQEYAIPR